MDRQRADVAAGKEQRRDDVAVGRRHHATAGDIKGRLVIAAAQPVIVESFMENVGNELRHRAAARTVRQVDAAMADIEAAAIGFGAHATLRSWSRKRL